MSSHPRRHSILAGVDLVDTTSSSNSGDLPNIGTEAVPTVILVVQAKGSVSGTSPTLDIQLKAKQASGDYTTISSVTQIIATSGTTPVRYVLQNVLEDTLRVDYQVGGTSTPTFHNVWIDLYFSSPSQ